MDEHYVLSPDLNMDPNMVAQNIQIQKCFKARSVYDHVIHNFNNVPPKITWKCPSDLQFI